MLMIRRAVADDAQAILQLKTPFIEDIVVSDEGRSKFSVTNIQTVIEHPNVGYFVAELDQQIIGAVAYRKPSHVLHFFVDQRFHGLGYGRQLWDFVEQHILQQNSQNQSEYQQIDAITVNSSMFAQPIYRHFGFVETDSAQEKFGMRYVPMHKCYQDTQES